MPELPRQVLFGAAYYHEYQTTDRLKTDLDLMLDANFTVIRVGESVWSTWEPDNGVFDLEWLAPVLDEAHARGIAVVLGTPTYAVPPWLARLYPEINAERASGQRTGWGARQEVDYTHAGFLFHAERVIRKIVDRYAHHPAVIGFQVDNEPGLQILHNHGTFQRFVDHLRLEYGTVERLNKEWGLVYWSHRLTTWADLWTPDGNAQPQYELAWRRFQARLTDEFIAWQAGIVREYALEHQFVTTCLAYDRPAMDDLGVTRSLDVTSANAYYVMQDGLQLPDAREETQTWKTDGTWAFYLSADRMYSSRQEPYFVTETNAATIGMAWDNRPAYDGQWRQAAWGLISRGASMIEYWHWHTLPFGTETYWGGVLPHSGEPGRTYDEVSGLGRELRAAGDLVAGLTPDADVAVVYSGPSKWLMQRHPALCHPDGSPDDRAYQGLLEPFYRGAFDAGLQARILHDRQLVGAAALPTLSPDQVAATLPILVAAGVYVASDELLNWFRAYVDAGGHLIVGPRTGYADLEARARTGVHPAGLNERAGVRYAEFSNLLTPVPVRASNGSDLHPPQSAAATRWVDGLLLDGADVLLEYDHPHFGRWPAITTRAAGTGRVTYVGTVPNPALAQSLFAWASAGQPRRWRGLPAEVTVTGATARDGTHLSFVHNWNWQPRSLAAPVDLRDVLSSQHFSVGDSIDLGPWDVRVFTDRERRDSDSGPTGDNGSGRK